MPVVRVHKTKNYTVMSNHHLRDKFMTLKTKGLLSLMLSLPEDWDYSIAGLVTLSPDSKEMVNQSLLELEQFGYLYREQDFLKGKFAGYIYNIYEEPLPPKKRKPVVDTENKKNKTHVSGNTVNGQTVNDNTVNGQGTNGEIYNINNNINNKYNKEILNKQISIDNDNDNSDNNDETNNNDASNGEPFDFEFSQSNDSSESDNSQHTSNANVNLSKTNAIPDYEVFYGEVKNMFPNTLGKKASITKQKEIFKMKDEFKRCIQRYLEDVKQRRDGGFKTLSYQNLSTFINGGYAPYTDVEWKKKHPQESSPSPSADSVYDANGYRTVSF